MALLSLEQVAEAPGALLLRLAHMYADGEDDELSRNATVQLAGLFAAFDVAAVTELSLFANAPLAASTGSRGGRRVEPNAPRMATITAARCVAGGLPSLRRCSGVHLTPLQVRTFRVNVTTRDVHT